ncbi:MAG: PadR family transcriptional regulator [Erythrobacter sp.]
MTGNRYGRGSGWDKLGEALAMMAATSSSNFAGPGFKMRWRWDDERAEGAEDGDEARPRQRRGRMFGTGELRLALLALIAEQPAHGYELIKAIEDMTGGAYAPSPGAVYPTLQLLEDEGAIEPAEAEGAKKPFTATEQGRSELQTRESEVTALMRRLGRHGDKGDGVRAPDLFRAMGNLANVLKNRAVAGKMDERTINEIVDLIDEMAKRIERI